MTKEKPPSLAKLLADAIKKHREEDEQNLTRRESPALYQTVIDAITNGTNDGLPQNLYSVALIFSLTAATEGRRLGTVEHIMGEYKLTKAYTSLMYHLNKPAEVKDDAQEAQVPQKRTATTRIARRYDPVNGSS